jgi:hypothetical protein
MITRKNKAALIRIIQGGIIMRQIEFRDLNHMDMIYTVLGEVRFVVNPKPEDGYVYTYHMTTGNDPCKKIKQQHIVFCVSIGEAEKDKNIDYLRSEFKKLLEKTILKPEVLKKLNTTEIIVYNNKYTISQILNVLAEVEQSEEIEGETTLKTAFEVIAYDMAAEGTLPRGKL